MGPVSAVSAASVVAAVLAFAAGALLADIASRLIARRLPRLGPQPAGGVRLTTAALTGVLCAAFFLRFGTGPLLPALVLLAVLGVQLARIDLAVHLLPNPLILTLGAGGFVLLLLPAFVHNDLGNLFRATGSAAIAFAFYMIMALISPGAMGMGDVKLAAPIGLYLGYLGWLPLVYGLLLGLAINGIVTLLIIAVKRGVKPKEVAHGPSMLAAVVGVLLFS